MNKVILFTIENQRYGCPIEAVERVILAAATLSLSPPAKYVFGILKMGDDLIPVLNLRQLFKLNERELEVNDQFILCRKQDERIAFWVDNVKDLVSYTEKEIKRTQQQFTAEHLPFDFIINHPEGPIFVLSIDQLLKLDSAAI